MLTDSSCRGVEFDGGVNPLPDDLSTRLTPMFHPFYTIGNGPQVGELALERSAATFDVLGAESVGQIGYVLAQAMASEGTIAVPIVTQVVVDPQHEAFRNPTKFVGPVYVL